MTLVVALWTASMFVVADANNTELEVLPNYTDVKKGTQITVGVYVTPQDGKTIDAVAINNITFDPSILQFVGAGVTFGNLFPDSTVTIDGDVDNTNGWITDTTWCSKIRYVVRSGIIRGVCDTIFIISNIIRPCLIITFCSFR